MTGFGAQSLALVGDGGGGGGLGVFLAISTTNMANPVAYSTYAEAGSNWTQGVAPNANPSTWQGVAYHPGLGYAILVSASGNVCQSFDGITWTSIVTNLPTVGQNYRQMLYSSVSGLFVLIDLNGDGDNFLTSPDGFTWTTRANPAVGAANANYVAIFENTVTGRLYAMRATGGVTTPLQFSDDGGITWTQYTHGSGISLSGGQCVGQFGNRVYWGGSDNRDFYADDVGTNALTPPNLILVLPASPLGVGSAAYCVVSPTSGVIVRRGINNVATGISRCATIADPGDPNNDFVNVETTAPFLNATSGLFDIDTGQFLLIRSSAGLLCLRSQSANAGTWTTTAAFIGSGTWAQIYKL